MQESQSQYLSLTSPLLQLLLSLKWFHSDYDKLIISKHGYYLYLV